MFTSDLFMLSMDDMPTKLYYLLIHKIMWEALALTDCAMYTSQLAVSYHRVPSSSKAYDTATDLQSAGPDAPVACSSALLSKNSRGMHCCHGTGASPLLLAELLHSSCIIALNKSRSNLLCRGARQGELTDDKLPQNLD